MSKFLYEDHGDFFCRFTPETIAQWEDVVRENPESTWNLSLVIKLLPFIKKVNPRVATKQCMMFFTIILLHHKYKKNDQLIRYGLEPLLQANILNQNEANQIVSWFFDKLPNKGDSSLTILAGNYKIQKEFKIDGIDYKLVVYSYSNSLMLSLD
jgi:hypothetical protein